MRLGPTKDADEYERRLVEMDLPMALHQSHQRDVNPTLWLYQDYLTDQVEKDAETYPGCRPELTRSSNVRPPTPPKATNATPREVTPERKVSFAEPSVKE